MVSSKPFDCILLLLRSPCSLLRDPQQLQAVVGCLVAAVGRAAAVSVKMRSGFEDTSLFRENLLAVQVGSAVQRLTVTEALPGCPCHSALQIDSK